MIRVLGIVEASGLIHRSQVHSWEQPGDVDVQIGLSELKQECTIDRPGSYAWIELREPTQPEAELVTRIFGLPRLLVEDAMNPRQRPKVEIHGDGHGLVLVKHIVPAQPSKNLGSRIRVGQLAIFISSWFVISFRFGAAVDEVRIMEHASANGTLAGTGSMGAVHALLDDIVDSYLVVVDRLIDETSEVEGAVFAQVGAPQQANDIYRLKRDSLDMRRAVNPLAPIAAAVSSETTSWVPDQLRPYLRDVGDHILRAQDSLESLDALLLALLTASTSLQDLQQNRDMRKISAWVAIVAVPTMIAGIYGMNFDYMPELHQPWGYPVVLGLMAGACIGLHRWFKRSGWL